MKLYRQENVSLNDRFGGFSNFSNNMVAGILVPIFTFLWSLLFFIPGIVKSFSYAMTFYILNDHPEYSATQAITESRKMMHGHKGELFVLYLSFLGWDLLSLKSFMSHRIKPLPLPASMMQSKANNHLIGFK
mgnify:CR=1 FL=1